MGPTSSSSGGAWPMTCTRPSTGPIPATSRFTNRPNSNSYQSESRQGTRPHLPARAARHRRRGHRVRRRDFTIGLLLAGIAGSVRGQEQAKQHRIAIIASRPVALIDGSPVFGAFFAELSRLGDVEGQNLTVERYSGGGRPAGYADVARQVV